MFMRSNDYFIKLFVLTAEFILINFSCKLAYFLRYHTLGAYEDYYVSFFIVFNLAWLGASLFNSAYDTPHLFSLKGFIRNLFTTLFFHLFIVFLYIVSMKAQYLSRLYILYAYASALMAVISFRSLMILIYKYYSSLSYLIRRIVLIGTEAGIGELGAFYDQRHTTVQRYVLREDVDMSEQERDQAMQDVIEQVKEYCLRERVDEIYISLPFVTRVVLDDLVDFADDHFIYFRILPDLYPLQRKRISLDFVGNIPVLALRREPLKNPLNRLLKRAFDIAFSGLVLLLVFPWAFPVIALAIRLGSPGPVIFRQLRSGRNNRTFWVYKFRTMRVNDEADTLQAYRDDKRITRLGAFLRRTSLDELPQFYNVLRGDMSVVGPRPHMIKHTDEYSRIIEKFLVRHFITPGITGHAQVHGYRGSTADPALMRRRVEYDTWYIENWSLLLDVRIVFQTIWMVLRGQDSAY
ncbi:MAG: undecaprenyl-phosphate glucose phosphotransferase [Bacteroidia bacterium]